MMMSLSAVGGLFLLIDGAFSFGIHGIIALGLCIGPLALGVLATANKSGLSRGQAVLSTVLFLLTGFKTSQSFQNTMMMAYLGMIICIVLAIKPEAK